MFWFGCHVCPEVVLQILRAMQIAHISLGFDLLRKAQLLGVPCHRACNGARYLLLPF